MLSDFRASALMSLIPIPVWTHRFASAAAGFIRFLKPTPGSAGVLKFCRIRMDREPALADDG